MAPSAAMHVPIRMKKEADKEAADKKKQRASPSNKNALRKVVPDDIGSFGLPKQVLGEGCNNCFTTRKGDTPHTMQQFLSLAVEKADDQVSTLPHKGTSFFWSPLQFLKKAHEFSLECQTLLQDWEDVMTFAEKQADDKLEGKETKLKPPKLADPADVAEYGFNGGLPFHFEQIVISRDIDDLDQEQLESAYKNNVTNYIEQMKAVYKEKKKNGERFCRLPLPDSQQFEEDGMFTGETLLHILIVKRDDPQAFENLKTLLQKCKNKGIPKILQMRATGLFFQQPFIVRPHWRRPFLRNLLNTLGVEPMFENPYSACYFGELPLSFAASVGNIPALDEIYKAVKEYDEDLSKEEKQLHAPTRKEILMNFLQEHDRYGNTALHMAIMYKQREVVDWFVSKCKRFKDWSPFKRFNYELLTPLTLAVQLGHMDLFDYILDKSSFARVIWQYGRCSHTEVDLDQIDSWQETIPVGRAPPGSERKDVWLFPLEVERIVEPRLQELRSRRGYENTQWTPMLYEVVNRELKLTENVGAKMASNWRDPRPLGAVEVAVKHEVKNASKNVLFTDIIEHKWRTHVRFVYFVLAIIPYVAFVTCATIYASDRARVHREAIAAGFDADSVAKLGPAGDIVYELIFLSVFTLLLLGRASIHLRLDYSDLDVNMDRKVEWVEIESFLFKNMVSFMSFVIVCLMWTAWILRAVGEGDWEMNVLSVLGMLAWVHGSTYLLPFRFFGILILSVHRMVVIDLLKFLVVYAFALLGFSLSIHVLLHNENPAELNLALEQDCGDCDTSWWQMTLRYLWASLGEVDLSNVMQQSRTPWLALFLHIVFIIMSTVLLLNLLIALLSRTFVETEEIGNERWWHEFAGTVLKHEDFWTKRVIPTLERWSPHTAYALAEELRSGNPDKGKCAKHKYIRPFYYAATRSHDGEAKEDLAGEGQDYNDR